MTTFSQLVDDVALELLRPDLVTSMAQWVNQTVRECHFKPGVAAPIKYDANRDEDQPTITTDDVWLWPIPSATRFQALEALYLVDVGAYAKPRKPEVNRNDSFEAFSQYYWYRTGPSIAVSGVAAGWTALVSFFQFPQTHQYKLTAQRIVQYNVDLDTYTRVGGGGALTDVEMGVETDWMIQRWGESVIKEGVRAKAFKRIGDEGRARMCFSAFETQRTGIWLSEPSS